MSSDLKLEIFAFQFFQAFWNKTGVLLQNHTVSSLYPDEYHLYPENTEIYEESHYKAVFVKGLFYHCVFEDELSKIMLEFECSPSYILDCISHTCGRDSLLGDLTVFELLLTSCAFVVELVIFSISAAGYKDILGYAHLCWAAYFDEYKEEFYGQGGWSQLKTVSLSYVLPFKLLVTFSNGLLKSSENRWIYVRDIIEAVYNYKRFMNYFDASSKTISKVWVKYHLQNFNKSDGSGVTGDMTKEEDKRNPKVVEKFLLQFRRLCDPNYSEVRIASCGKSKSIEPCKQNTEEIDQSLLKLNNLTINDTTPDSTFYIKLRGNELDFKEFDQANKLIAVDLFGREFSGDQTDKLITIDLSQVKWNDEHSSKSVLISLPRMNEDVTHNTNESGSLQNTPLSKLLKTSSDDVSRNKTQTTSKRNPNEETKNEIDLERESPDVQSLLRMILILGDPEGIAHLRSTLPNSDLHQRMKKSKK